ncbi:MAG: hypothetical protein MJZ34_08310 [Paludibacteraceae bacterium]|nr:hypothetical protein [Paludibacteraceae bacterium]
MKKINCVLILLITFVFIGCGDNGVSSCDCKREISYTTYFGLTFDELAPRYLKDEYVRSLNASELLDSLRELDKISCEMRNKKYEYGGGRICNDFPYDNAHTNSLEEAISVCSKIENVEELANQARKKLKNNNDYFLVEYIGGEYETALGYDSYYCFVRREDKLVLND